MKLLNETSKISKFIESGDVSIRHHPTLPLSVYCYTKQHFYAKDAWTEVTKQTRGIVFDNLGNVVARPFPKIFNIGENQIDKGFVEFLMETYAFTRMDKANGHLCIASVYNDQLVTNTKGSFTSDFADADYQICINSNIDKVIKHYKEQYGLTVTVCCEIIADYDKHSMYDHMVDMYGNNKAVILAIINNETGKQVSKSNFSFDVTWVKYYDDEFDLSELYKAKNREGYVLYFPHNNFYVKIKCDEYWQTRVKNEITAKKILSEFKKHGYDKCIEIFDEEIKPILDYTVYKFNEYVNYVLDGDYLSLLVHKGITKREAANDNTLTPKQKIYIIDHMLGNKYLDDINSLREMFHNDVTNEKVIQQYIDQQWLNDLNNQ